MNPTSEQAAIVDAFKAGKSLVIEAGAGTGKTSTLELLGRARPDRQMIYIAYNKAIATDAEKRFPSNVRCSTAHSLAYRAIGHRFRARLNGGRMPAREVAKVLGLKPARLEVQGGRKLVLDPARLARIVMATVGKFCRTAKAQVEPWMVEAPTGIEPAEHELLRDQIVPIARTAWEDIVKPDGVLPFAHDCYLKLWSLSKPKLACDVLLLDEAQDADPLIADVVMRQGHAQQILVGDANQAIYGWRGAVDAMSSFEADARLQLSQSFRFGPAIATEANKWLGILGSDLRLRGFEKIRSTVADVERPDAVLCRTNAGAVGQVMSRLGRGDRVALVGGGEQIRSLAEAAITLQAGAGTTHPELMAFQTWEQLKEYVDNDVAGSDLKTFVTLIERHGADAVLRTVDRLVPENRANVVVSTAHKAKGREWSTVYINSDFREPGEDADGVSRAESMLAYVAVTRAKETLDRHGLAWVDEWT
jgi:hypothetical protein